MKHIPVQAKVNCPAQSTSTESTEIRYLYLKVPSEIARDTELSGDHKLLFGAINSLSLASEGRCIASNPTLAKYTGQSVSNVELGLRALKARRHIDVVMVKRGVRDHIAVTWQPTQTFGSQPPQTLGTYVTQELGIPPAQTLGTEKIFEKSLFVGESVSPTRDDVNKNEIGRNQVAIPEDVLEEIMDLLGNDVAARVVKAGDSYHRWLGKRWDALVDAATILSEKLNFGTLIKDPPRYLLGTAKKVLAKLRVDKRLTEDGKLADWYWAEISNEVVQSLYDDIHPTRIIATVGNRLKEDGAGSLVTRLTEELVDASIRIACECEGRWSKYRYLDEDGEPNKIVKVLLSDDMERGLSEGVTAEAMMSEVKDKMTAIGEHPDVIRAVQVFMADHFGIDRPDPGDAVAPTLEKRPEAAPLAVEGIPVGGIDSTLALANSAN